ncbi:MAG: hypothetical protein KAX24_02850, partial [Anaerolineae bacterium]|nr:hypothetical protein [Anaerolineae bacterium]
MTDPFSDRYWHEEFQVTRADLDRIAVHIRETGQVYDLTALARRVVRGRLRHGPETSAPAQSAWAEDPSVRLWNPAGEWKEGDHVIVAVAFYERSSTRHRPFVGEVIKIGADKVAVRIDALGESRSYYTRAKYSADDLHKWRRLVEERVAARRGTKDVETQIEYVLLEHGERVVSQLLDGLRADECFVRLAGRWFLRELAVSPTDEQLTALAWAMVPLSEPQPTADLAPLVQPPLAEGAPGLFGLYLALCDRSALFENADPGKRPRWILAAPPPGSCMPRHAAYDPEAYEVLCLPGEPIPPEVIGRLWDLGL